MVDRVEAPARTAARPPFHTQFLHPRYWPTWLGLGLLRLLSLMPSRCRRALGARCGDIAYNVNAKRRRIARVNLALCFPEASDEQRKRWLRRHFQLLGIGLLDYALLWFASDARLAAAVEVRGEEYLMRCRAQGRNVILMTGHSTALEFGPVALSNRYPMVGPYKAAKNPLIDWFMARGRLRYGGFVFERGVGPLGYARALKQGQVLFTLSDEDLGPGHSVFAPFFGTPKATLQSVARLAKLTDAAVLPCMSFYCEVEGKYRVILRPPLRNFPSGDREQDAADMNRELEQLIERHPEQYMWTFKLFRTRPEGAAPIYR